MAQLTFRGILQDRTHVVLDEAVPLPEGTRVEVTPLVLEKGSPAALIAAMEAEPHLDPEDVAEFERGIAAGQRPPVSFDLFSDTPESPECQ